MAVLCAPATAPAANAATINETGSTSLTLRAARIQVSPTPPTTRDRAEQDRYLDKVLHQMYITNMSLDIAMTDARSSLGDLAARAEYGGETVYLTKHGRRAAAVVSARTAELLEQLEDLLDAAAVAEVQARIAAGSEGRRRLVSAPPPTTAG